MNREEGTPDASAHKWNEGVVTTEPTIDAEGVKTFTCGVCGETKTEAIDKLTHAHDYESVVKAPTCTEAGYTTFTCECGDSYTGNEVAALGHKAVSAGNAVAADCITAGKEADTVCSVCDAVIAEGAVIPALGHKAVSAGNAVAADCTTAGKEADTVCSVCDAVIAEGAVIPAKGHNHVADSVKTATCDEDGYTTYKCTNCGDTYTGDVVEAAGHDYSKVYWEFNDDITEKTKVSECGTCGDVKTEGPFECDH